MLRNFFVRFWLFVVLLGHSGLAHGQTALQAQYFRLAKSASVQIVDDLTLNVSTGRYSNVFDARAYGAVSIRIAVNNIQCAYNPLIEVYGGDDPATVAAHTSGVYLEQSRASSYILDTVVSNVAMYNVKVSSPYVIVRVGSASNAPNPEPCTADVWATLVPMFDGPDVTSAASRREGYTWGIAEVTTSASRVGPTLSEIFTANITVQNQSASVIYCAPTIGGLSTSMYGVSLAAGSSAANGTGGSWTFEATGAVYCIVASGTANVSWVAN